jgi:hypothetical protein
MAWQRGTIAQSVKIFNFTFNVKFSKKNEKQG